MDLLPNCLSTYRKTDNSLPQVLGANWFYLFCANCGKDCGRVLDTYLPEQYAFALCDLCAETYGEVAGVTATPFDVFFTKVAHAMQEEFGHGLTDSELARELDNPDSTMSKLNNDGLQLRR